MDRSKSSSARKVVAALASLTPETSCFVLHRSKQEKGVASLLVCVCEIMKGAVVSGPFQGYNASSKQGINIDRLHPTSFALDYTGGISYVSRPEPLCELVHSLPFPASHPGDSMLYHFARPCATCRAQTHSGILADDHRSDRIWSETLPTSIAYRQFFSGARSTGYSRQC